MNGVGLNVSTVASVEPLESYFEAHELFDSTMEAKPVVITRNEVYGMLGVLMRNTPAIVSDGRWLNASKRMQCTT